MSKGRTCFTHTCMYGCNEGRRKKGGGEGDIESE